MEHEYTNKSVYVDNGISAHYRTIDINDKV